MQSTTILVVDDEPPILDLIASYLRADGFSVHTAQDGPSALAQARAVRPDLIVLDVMLPGMDGMEVCRRIQQEFDVYILMLTARAEEIDKIVGLSVGADDYLTKPFSPRELVMRVKAILRRSRALGPRPAAQRVPERPALRFDDLLIDPDTREVWHDSAQVELTPREFDLLYALAEQPGRVFNRDQLLERVWGHDFAGIDRVVDVHIGLLRRKLEDDPANPTVIQTVRGVGYKFVGRRK
jgi:two-component system, OmpR family, alkaline phosphatase synthesis response regulator PhoP